MISLALEGTPRGVLYFSVLFIQALALVGTSVWCVSADFDPNSYRNAINQSIFGNEFSFTCLKMEKSKGSEPLIMTIRYSQLGDLRKIEHSLIEAPSDNPSLGKTYVAIQADYASVFFSKVHDTSNVEYFVDAVVHDSDQALTAFYDILPAFAPYAFRKVPVSQRLADRNFKALSQQEVGGDIRVAWSSSVTDNGEEVGRTGFFIFDIENGWVLKEASESVGLKGSAPQYTIDVLIEYSLAGGRKLPSRIVQSKTVHGDGIDTVTRTEDFSDIVYDFSPVDISEFDLAKYGFSVPGNTSRVWVYAGVLSGLLLCLGIVRRVANTRKSRASRVNG